MSSPLVDAEKPSDIIMEEEQEVSGSNEADIHTVEEPIAVENLPEVEPDDTIADSKVENDERKKSIEINDDGDNELQSEVIITEDASGSEENEDTDGNVDPNNLEVEADNSRRLSVASRTSAASSRASQKSSKNKKKKGKKEKGGGKSRRSSLAVKKKGKGKSNRRGSALSVQSDAFDRDESLMSSNINEEEDKKSDVDEFDENTEAKLVESTEQSGTLIAEDTKEIDDEEKAVENDIDSSQIRDDVDVIELKENQDNNDVDDNENNLKKIEVAFEDNSDVEETFKPDSEYVSNLEGDGVDILHEDEINDNQEEKTPTLTREELIEQLHQAQATNNSIKQKNYQLQHKLCEYLRKRKGDDSQREMGNSPENQQKYVASLAKIVGLKQKESELRDDYKIQIEELKQKCLEKQLLIDSEGKTFIDYKKAVALNAISSRTGKTLPIKEVEKTLNLESKKELEVVEVRLENIKLKNKLKKKEMQLKSREELAEGLHLIDFEQLKIENQTYNEKIEERNEELVKLRVKNANHLQIQTHLKEKMEFVQEEVQTLKLDLVDIDEDVKKKRDNLTRLKQVRDRLRNENQKLKQNAGLQGNELLLRNFEEIHDETFELTQKLEKLKQLHAEKAIACSRFRQKINRTNKLEV